MEAIFVGSHTHSLTYTTVLPNIIGFWFVQVDDVYIICLRNADA